MSHVADAMLKRVGGRSGQGRGKAIPEDRAACALRGPQRRFGSEEAGMKEQTLSPAERCPALSVDSKPLGVLDVRIGHLRPPAPVGRHAPPKSELACAPRKSYHGRPPGGAWQIPAASGSFSSCRDFQASFADHLANT